MKSNLKIYWLTNLPAPYRLPIFRELGNRYLLHIDFLLSSENWRKWSSPHGENFNFTFLNLKCWRILDFEFVPRLRIRRDELAKSQIVVIGSWEAPQYLWTALVAKVTKKTLILIYESTLDSQRYTNRFIHFIRSSFFKKGDMVIAFGKESSEALLRMGVSREKVLQLFNPIPRVPPDSLKVEPKANSHKYLFVGQLIARKNIDGLISAFAEMRNQSDSLTIVGEGMMQRALIEQVETLKLVNHVEFISHIEPSQMNTFYQGFCTLVLPSFREVWGLVVNEALANGLHVVVSNQCGSASFVQNMRGVYITDNRKEGSLVSQMKRSSENYEGKILIPEIWQYDTFAFSSKLIEAIDGVHQSLVKDNHPRDVVE
jgi:glycosyltransferase involved in cell wall biosynthesis